MLDPARAMILYGLFGVSAGDTGPSIGDARLLPGSKKLLSGPAFRAEGVLVETPRLLLRKYARGDREGLHDLLSDPAMFRFSHRGPMSREESWAMLLRHVGHWQLCGHGVFAIVDKASGRVVGEAGPCDFQRRLGPDFDDFPEITWSISPVAQGQGYATEAAAAALGWLERERGAGRTVCLIHAENAASIAVAERLGYRRFERRHYRGYEALLMARAGRDRAAPIETLTIVGRLLTRRARERDGAGRDLHQVLLRLLHPRQAAARGQGRRYRGI